MTTKKQRIKTSIIILSKEKLYFLKPSVTSLLANLKGGSYEILIGDTGSTSLPVLKYYQKVTNQYPDVVKVHKLETYHFSRNNNDLSIYARGENLLFLNNDTYTKNDFLTPMLRQLNTGNAGIVGAKLLHHDDTVQHAGMEFAEVFADQIIGYHVYQRRQAGMPEVNISKIVPAVTGACLLIRAELFRKVGGFDEAYAEEAQDTDLCMKVAHSGLSCVYEADAILYHFESGSRKSRENAKDRALFHRRWSHFIKSNYLGREEQSVIISESAAKKRQTMQKVLFSRAGNVESVFAATAIIALYKKANPNTHITYKSEFPELVDQAPGIDRALTFGNIDTLRYDKTILLDCESGLWPQHPITWIEEMARQAKIVIPRGYELRPVFTNTKIDSDRLVSLSVYFESRKWITISTGSEQPERQWTNANWKNLTSQLIAFGYSVAQIGRPGDIIIEGTVPFTGLPLRENLEILRSSEAAVLPDDFPLYLAMAVKTPTIFLSCQSCRHTTYLTSNIVQLRNIHAQKTPLPTCRSSGCLSKKGPEVQERCESPILHSLPVSSVIFSLQAMLDQKWRKRSHD